MAWSYGNSVLNILETCQTVFQSGCTILYPHGASLVAQLVKNRPAIQETWVQSLGCGLRREWLPTPVFWPGEFHGLYSQMRLQRVIHNWVTFTHSWAVYEGSNFPTPLKTLVIIWDSPLMRNIYMYIYIHIYIYIYIYDQFADISHCVAESVLSDLYILSA